MKLGWHGASSMFASLETDIAVCAQAGFSGLELWAGKIDVFLRTHPALALRDLLAENGVEPLGINSLEFIAFRGSDFDVVLDRCRAMSALARDIGCTMLVVVPSPTPRRDMPWREIVVEYVGVLRELGAIAADHGVRLAFEFLGFGWSTVRTPRGAWEIVRATDRPNVGVGFDAAHFYGGGGGNAEIALLDPAQIFTFHLDDLEDLPKEAITDANRLLPGRGILPLDSMCQCLSAIGYDGPCSVELFRPEYWQWQPLDLAMAARDAATRVLEPHFRLG